MGHSTVQMTFDLYGHLFEDKEADREAMAKLEAGSGLLETNLRHAAGTDAMTSGFPPMFTALTYGGNYDRPTLYRSAAE